MHTPKEKNSENGSRSFKRQDDKENMPPNLETLLDGIALPAAKTDIIAYAQTQGAGPEALELFYAMPERRYETMKEINKGLGLVEKLPGNENLWPSRPSDKEQTGKQIIRAALDSENDLPAEEEGS